MLGKVNEECNGCKFDQRINDRFEYDDKVGAGRAMEKRFHAVSMVPTTSSATFITRCSSP